MGKGTKRQPKRLAYKLLTVRKFLGFIQEEMIKHIQPDIESAPLGRAALSDYESGRRAPSPLEVFYYAKTVRDLTVYKNFTSDDLTDDSRVLPFSASGKNAAPIKETDLSQETETVINLKEESGIVSELTEAHCSAKDDFKDSPQTVSTPPITGADEVSAQLIEDYNEVEIDYKRSFYFSWESLLKFDDFMMRLQLASPYRLREHCCDSSVAVEIAIAAALRDLERMDRQNKPSVVVECLHEHVANHFEN